MIVYEMLRMEWFWMVELCDHDGDCHQPFLGYSPNSSSLFPK